MTKRTLGLICLSATTILLFNEQMAYSSDTIWDLLRRGDPAQKRDTPIVLPGGPSAGGTPGNVPAAGPSFPVATIGGPQALLIDRMTAGPNNMWDLLRSGDPAQKRDIPTFPLDLPFGSAMVVGQPAGPSF